MSEETFEEWSLNRDMEKIEKLRKELGLSRGELKAILSHAVALQILKDVRREIRSTNRSVREQIRYLGGSPGYLLLLKRTKAQMLKQKTR